jgi:penicillin-binding protein 2
MIVRLMSAAAVMTALPMVAQELAPPPARPAVAVPAKPAPAHAVPVRATPIGGDTAVATPVAPAAAKTATAHVATNKPVLATPVIATPRPADLAARTAAETTIPGADLNLQPSFETQKLARTFVFTIPPPRGLITDRNGIPLAQTRVAQYLAIQFPTPLQFTDAEVTRYIAEQLAAARQILRRDVTPKVDGLKHYKNRGIMPLVIATDLRPDEVEAIKRNSPAGLTLQAVYQRVYPQGSTAVHIVGYASRQGGFITKPVENNEPLFSGMEGRAGLEQAYDAQLTGKPGVMHVSFDAQGRKSAEKVIQPPVPGSNVVTTIDLKLQRLCESSIQATGRPGAMVMTDPNTGEILVMASLPSYDPSLFVPNISTEDFAKLNDDPNFPLIGRAFASSYPLGSVFKIITGLSMMNEGVIDPDDEFEGSPTLEIGNRIFKNHTTRHQGMLNFAGALTVSCNTYFYRIGLKGGAKPILDYADRLGLNKKTGIPLPEVRGNLPTEEYMQRVEHRKNMPGDVANLAIGQGAVQVTPLQVALAMGTIGNGGTVYRPRLVSRVQSVDEKIELGSDVTVRDQIEIEKNVMKAIRAGMVGVVQGRGGTATAAAIPGVLIAAKTGTAQWGQKPHERVAAWFAGFAPADRPKYAFASVYEGKEARNDVHGGSHAAPVVSRVLKEILKPEPKEKKGGGLRKKQMIDDDDEVLDDSKDEDSAPKPKVVRPADPDENVD